MTESLKSRETMTEYQLVDGQIEYHTIDNCQFTNNKI